MRLRESVRALLLDPADRVLLVHFDWPGLDVPGGFWANPGGGIEPGESRLDALRRELREEVGWEPDELGPEVWVKTAVHPMGDWDGQVDHVHLQRTSAFDPAPALSPEQLLAEHVHAVRWWTVQEMEAGDAVFAPRAMPALLARLRTEGPPAEPIRIDGF